MSEPFGSLLVDVIDDQGLDAFSKKSVGHGGSRTASAKLQDCTGGNAREVAPERFGKSIAVGVVAEALAVAKDDGVHRSKGLSFLGKMVKQGENALFAGEGDVQAGKAHALGSAKKFRKSIDRQVEFIEVNELIEAA